MKKNLWLLFPFFLCFLSPSYAQIHENALLLEENLRFFKKKITTKQNEVQTGFYFGQNIGIFMHKNWVFGTGLSYQKNNVTGESITTLTTSPPTPGGIIIPVGIITQTYKTEERTWTPTVYIKAYQNLSEKLYISGKLAYMYGITKSNKEDSSLSPFSSSNSWQHNRWSSNNIALTTELLFFVSKRMGLQMNFNGFNFSANKNLLSNPTKYTDFSFDMSPINWTFGAVILLN